MINTFNESSLHKELKEKYKTLCGGKCEIECEGFICDVISDKIIYEIQTANLSKLRAKIEKLSTRYKLCVVFTVAENTEIITVDQNEKFLSKRKSPKKENIFCIFRQITGILDLFNLENFSIKVLLINQQRIRQKTSEAVQLINKSRRKKREWVPLDKKLTSINGELEIESTDDLINLVKAELEKLKIEKFCAKDLKNSAIKEYASWVIWGLKKINAIKYLETLNKIKYFIFVK